MSYRSASGCFILKSKPRQLELHGHFTRIAVDADHLFVRCHGFYSFAGGHLQQPTDKLHAGVEHVFDFFGGLLRQDAGAIGIFGCGRPRFRFGPFRVPPDRRPPGASSSSLTAALSSSRNTSGFKKWGVSSGISACSRGSGTHRFGLFAHHLPQAVEHLGALFARKTRPHRPRRRTPPRTDRS